MTAGFDIARIAALIGEPTRAEILLALLGGEALTATELAQCADITKQTASAHLARLLDADLLRVASQGRHRYFRLADADIAHVLETLLGVAARSGKPSVRRGPRDAGLRKARVCYDHLAGELGVRMLESMIAQGLLTTSKTSLEITPVGQNEFAKRGIDIEGMQDQRRPLCRQCLDWSVRRHHLGGALGAALLTDVFANGWARRSRDSRAIVFTVHGEAALRRRYPV